MNKPILLLSIVTLIACQNKNTKQTTDRLPVKEQLFLKLSGEEQYVEITGASDDLPILLFLHGGPGWPQTPHLRYFNAGLTKEMIVVSWDQAGCGKSYLRNPTPKEISLEGCIRDAHELTQYLKKKFDKEKIYLLGFSYGSVIGLKLAEMYPQDYYAYIGVSQIIDTKKNWTFQCSGLKIKPKYERIQLL